MGSGGGGGGTGDDAATVGFGETSDDASAIFSSGDGGSLTVSNACAYSISKGAQQALDVYIMLDQSASMVGPKWTGVTAAINAFVMQPLTGVSVGIQYFALNLLDCTASDYATPEVEIAPLPGVASKITQSLSMHAPISTTPTVAAEQGAVQHATDWAKSHPADAVIVVLATDGDPDMCNILPDPLTPVEQVASMGFMGTPKIPTFVIGVGSDTSNLDAIAQAGGTGNAFIVDTNMPVDTQFLAALNKIRGSALGCNYKIPAPAERFHHRLHEGQRAVLERRKENDLPAGHGQGGVPVVGQRLVLRQSHDPDRDRPLHGHLRRHQRRRRDRCADGLRDDHEVDRGLSTQRAPRETKNVAARSGVDLETTF